MAAGLYDITNEVLGKGHFAIVKLAKHCLTGEHVAIKIIDKSKLNKEALEQLSCEIRLWSILSEQEHPNVVKLYQCIDTRSKLYLVMEYCGSHVCDLYDHIQKKNDGNGLEESEAKHIFRQVCNAILYCHSLRIVHRDLKPENILIITNQNNINPMVKLIDFGFSNQWSDNEMLQTSCGSLAYSAPEILLGNQYYGPKVDIWSLGCILYILLYGSNPFMQFNDNETLIKILDCSFSTPKKSSISESSIDLIKKLLKKDPQTRLTIEEILSHSWLDNNALSSTANKGEEDLKGTFHDEIIDQMIDQGIGVSKDVIENIINNRHSEKIEFIAKDIESLDNKLKDHHYIKATYHLLKDKTLREFTGVEHSITSHNKRGNILKKANIRKSNMNEGNKYQGKLNIRSSKSVNQNLNVPENAASFVLPLARKCSIVSEEGSAHADTNLPDLVEMDRSSEADMEDSVCPVVDIFVTDSSSNCNTSEMLHHSDFNDEGNKLGTNLTKKVLEKLNKESGLHSVSSSPDFLNSETLDCIEDHSKKKTNTFEHQSKDTFNLAELNDDTILSLYTKEKSVKLNNVRVMKQTGAANANNSNQSSKSPSMRVIIQSKSLHNIALAEQQGTKMTNSMSTVNIKDHKHEKTDCCIIS